MIVTYEAIDQKGSRCRDSVEATDTRDAVEILRRRGLYVTRAEAADEGKKKTPAAHMRRGKTPRLPLNTLALVTRQLAMLLHSGSGVVPAISSLRRQMTKPHHEALLAQIVSDLEGGLPLTDALRKHPRTFDAVYCAIVAAGEASGALDSMFERLARIVGKRRAMVRKLLGACAYPALLITMCTGILAVLTMFVLPRFAEMFDRLSVETPASTQMLLGFGAAMRTYWYLVAAAVLTVCGLVTWTVTSRAGKQWLTDIQLSIPIVGRLRCRLIQGQLFRTMGTLLESGVGILETLELARGATRNRRFQRLFTRLEDTVTSGNELSSAFGEGKLIEPYICQAIRTGEDSGNLGGAMTYVADILDESNEELVNTVARLIEPVILIGMGFVVGGVAISLFLPLFDLTAAIN
ncbi:MAG: type II secretion system F family protein [Planctomycetes bacterium]|nr:type II secretion system F family protein [Planctomycetota bacterium]